VSWRRNSRVPGAQLAVLEALLACPAAQLGRNGQVRHWRWDPVSDARPAAGLHPLLRQRWSPRAFDPAHEMTGPEIDLLLEAARWAPSAGNSQPWAFVAARRGEPDHARLVEHLARSTASWAPTAALLVLNVAHRWVDDSDLEYSEFAMYDLGQAVAHLTVQAQAMALASRQFRAFDKEAIEAEFGVGRGWELICMTAVGRPLRVEAPQREPRRPVADLRWSTR
jgi:nitroreductase